MREEVNDIKYHIFKLLRYSKNCKKSFIRSISNSFYAYICEGFNFNGRFKNGDIFLQHFEIKKTRNSNERTYSEIDTFQLRLDRPKRMSGYVSQPRISIKFIRLDKFRK